MYTPEQFDEKKTQVMKYILYKKRTESEVRNKFLHTIEENLLDDIIEYLKEAGYINDKDYIRRLVNEYINLKNMSIREMKNKIYSKGIYADEIEDYINENKEMLEEYELKSAKKLIEKKKNIEKPKLKNYLVNKGFDPDIINKLLKEEN